MNAPEWLNDIVRAFGRQMGLQTFALTERGTAGVTFENGVRLRFEYVGGALMVLAGVPCGADVGAVRRLLQGAHYGANRGATVRAARLAKSDEGIWSVRIPERAVTVTEVERVFRIVWEAAVAFGRSVA